MDDQTAIDVYKRGTYSDDHREHRDGDGDAPKGVPIEHDATLTESVGAGLGRRHRGHQAPGSMGPLAPHREGARGQQAARMETSARLRP